MTLITQTYKLADMSKILYSCCRGLITVLLFSCLSYAQTEDTYFLKVDYLKADGVNITNYLELEQELWKPIHQERINRGIIKSWNLYGVVAGGPDSKYNFIVANLFDEFGKIDYYDIESIITDVHPDVNVDDFMDQTHNSREVVHTEIWEVNGTIMNEETTPGGNYLTINYFDARGGSGEHAKMELDFWGAIHEVRVEREILNSWAMYTLLYPSGDARNYTYSTIDYYDELSDLREPVGMTLARVAHPNLTEDQLDEYFSRTGDSRSLYKTELWKVIDSVRERK